MKMKDQRITIPENTRVIIDGDIIIFEPKTTNELKVGKWCYSSINTATALLVNENLIVGFNSNNGWLETETDLKGVEHNWELADMKEVEKLLIGEAEKRGAKKGCKVRFLGNDNIFKPVNEKFDIRESPIIALSGFYFGGIELFNFNTGKWAEIIPEKKPLYTNSYGTEFFEGDEVSWIIRPELKITTRISDKSMRACDHMDTTEIMTKREYHRYLADNWDELNKNK